MGLFGLFDKKYCSVCGAEIGLLGNKKLEDGNLCKNCAERLSPWFSERRHSTVEEIRAQLQWKEENRVLAERFHADRAYGEYRKLYVDYTMQCFAVNAGSDFRRDWPDVLDLSCITDCYVQVRESRTEICGKDPQGRSVSFNPPRYEYEYDFMMHIQVNVPFYDEMVFRLNSSSVDGMEWDKCRKYEDMAEEAVEAVTGTRPDYSREIPQHRPFCRVCGTELDDEGVCPVCNPPVPPAMPFMGGARPLGGNAFQTREPGARPMGAQPVNRPAEPARPMGAQPMNRPAEPARPMGAQQMNRPAEPTRPMGAQQMNRPAEPARPMGAQQMNRGNEPGRPTGAQQMNRGNEPGRPMGAQQMGRNGQQMPGREAQGKEGPDGRKKEEFRPGGAGRRF